MNTFQELSNFYHFTTITLFYVMTKVVPIIKCTCLLFSLITSEIFQITHQYRYQFVGEFMTDM